MLALSRYNRVDTYIAYNEKIILNNLVALRKYIQNIYLY